RSRARRRSRSESGDRTRDSGTDGPPDSCPLSPRSERRWERGPYSVLSTQYSVLLLLSPPRVQERKRSPGLQERLELAQRAQVAHRGGGLGQAQDHGDLLVGHLLEMAHQDNLAVVLVQRGNGGVQAALHLVLHGGRGRRQFLVEELPG